MRRAVVTLAAVAAAVLAMPSGVARAQQSSATAAASASPALSAADLDRALLPLGDPDVERRRAASKAASNLDANAVGAIGDRLMQLRRASGPSVAQTVRSLRQPGRDVDLLEVLLAPSYGALVDPQGVRSALEYVCLVRSLAHIGTTPAVRLLVPIVADAGGELKPELQRAVKGLGDKAVAALIEARNDPTAEIKRWSGAMLDMLGKRLPSDAVQTKDRQILADVMRAYGAVKDLDAVQVILSFANDASEKVRSAARDALMAYGSDAAWKLKDAYQAVTGHPANDSWSASELAKELFDALDRFRLQEVYALLDDGLAAERAGRIDDAVADFDRVLARQPELDRRSEMVPAFVDYAREIEDTDRTRALERLHEALHLADASETPSVKSEIAYVEGEDLLARGIPDTEHFRTAIELDPTNARARAELQKLELEADRKQANLNRWVAGGATLAVAVAGVILFGGRRRRR
jgi:tetratricopeptide (TPR) repeat protein